MPLSEPKTAGELQKLPHHNSPLVIQMCLYDPFQSTHVCTKDSINKSYWYQTSEMTALFLRSICSVWSIGTYTRQSSFKTHLLLAPLPFQTRCSPNTCLTGFYIENLGNSITSTVYHLQSSSSYSCNTLAVDTVSQVLRKGSCVQ